MVGVPGRSKACATCRRRKKGLPRVTDVLSRVSDPCLLGPLLAVWAVAISTLQIRLPKKHREIRFDPSRRRRPRAPAANFTISQCDFQRPSCSQCRRAGLECGGYERGRIFVHTTQEFPSSVTSFRDVATVAPASNCGPAWSSGPVGKSTTGAVSGRNNASGRPPGQRSADLRIVPVHFGHPPTSPPGADRSLIKTAQEDVLLSGFWEAYLPNHTAISEKALRYASGGWVSVVQSLYRSNKVLHYSLMANCYSTIARREKSLDMAEQSLRVHGRALHELRLALYRPDEARSDGVFSALRLMIAFTMFFSDRFEQDRKARARGWKQHNAGVKALLRARGPEAHVSGDGHQMFVDCRLPLIVSDIMARRRTILNSTPWLTIPWTEIPKTPKDELVDIVSYIPSLLQGLDWLGGMPLTKTREELRAKLISTCWHLDRQLCDWYEARIPNERMALLESLPPASYISTEDLSFLYSVCIYCTAALLVYQSMHVLEIPDLPQRATLSTYMNRIARHLDLFFQPNSGQYGVEMASFPLGLCLQILTGSMPPGDDATKEKSMFNALLATEKGKEILDFLRSMLET